MDKPQERETSFTVSCFYKSKQHQKNDKEERKTMNKKKEEPMFAGAKVEEFKIKREGEWKQLEVRYENLMPPYLLIHTREE